MRPGNANGAMPAYGFQGMPNMAMNPYAANFMMRPTAQHSAAGFSKWHALIIIAIVGFVVQMGYAHWERRRRSEKRLQKMLDRSQKLKAQRVKQQREEE